MTCDATTLRLCLGILLTALIVVPCGIGVAATGDIQFQTGSVTFPSGGSVPFPSGSIAFPSSIERTETPTTIEVVLPADVLFDFDKADIRLAAEATMHDVAQLIRDKGRGPVTIRGFTDALGTESYNQRLSERRAASVKSWLVAREGLTAKLFTTSGLGARDPVAPNHRPDGSDDPEGRQRNRRVTLIIRK